MVRVMILTIFLLINSVSPAAIYGRDDRRDLYQVPYLSNQFNAVAVAVPNILIIDNKNQTFTMDSVDQLNHFLCKDERFYNQPSLGVCTGFLVGSRYLVTAGHCALPNGIIDNSDTHPFCQDFSWYFGYNNATANSTGPYQNISNQNLYHCKKIIRAENTELADKSPGDDFAVIELDRDVNVAKPLTLSTSSLSSASQVYTIGHPTGMPAKFSGYSPITENSNAIYFASPLDTEGGNSGGPVFNTQNEVVGILVSGHAMDYYTDAQLGCQRANTCDENGLHCKSDSPFSSDQIINFIERIERFSKYIPQK